MTEAGTLPLRLLLSYGVPARLFRMVKVHEEREHVLRAEDDVQLFEEFVKRTEPRLRDALSATLGSQLGRDATADALAYAWEHWDRISSMENPAGYLYVLGRNRGRKTLARRRPLFLAVREDRTPWVEPGLPEALSGLPEKQRAVVMLVYCFEWTMGETAELLGVTKSTVQTHAERGMRRLRRRLGVSA